MHQITVKYRPFTLCPFFLTAKGSFPSAWADVSSWQLIALASLYRKEINEVDFMSIFTGIKKKVIRKMPDYALFHIGRMLEWIEDLKPHNEFMIEKIKVNGITFCSPLPKLQKMTFAQFIFSDTYFSNYSETKDPDDLNHLLASLYLPEKEIFSEEIISENYRIFRDCEPAIKEAVALNYKIVRDWLCDVYPMVFVKSEPAKHREDRPKRSADTGRGWVKIFEQVVGDDIVNQDKYADLPIHNVLRFLSGKIKENMRRRNN